ncbi:TPA: accessory Sec system protein Asp2 [Staphylococcus aureus]|nr:accessory Sec system protein Asp2 [Staphylococcus aureus]
MPRKFRVLQIGGDDLEPIFQHKKGVSWDYFDIGLFEFDSGYVEAIEAIVEAEGRFDFIYIQAPYSETLTNLFQMISEPYNTYVDESFWSVEYEQDENVQKYVVQPLHYRNIEERNNKLEAVSFSGQYGDKVSPKLALVHPNFKGDVVYQGNSELTLSGEFGKEFKPIASWQNNLVYDKDKVIQIWPEFDIDGAVELQYTFRLIQTGADGALIEQIILTDDMLDSPLEIPTKPFDAYISVTVKARGNGTVHLGPIHKRWSRLDMGQFLLGGSRFVDSQRQEFIYYFHPGDMKPPLNVYFSGYRTAEGFEGYYMMKRMNAPFLLIGDPRVEGGSFYIGSSEYEQGIINVIDETLEKLNFKSHELILSGLSMGSFGALYYGAQLNPQAIIVGKPLVNIGTIAEHMRLLRPEEFGTALDVLVSNEGDTSQASIQALNQKFWQTFQKKSLSQTVFAIAYMQHDDYDPHAFQELLPVLTAHQARVMNCSIPGRHNDDSPTIASWFVNFYNIILEEFNMLKNKTFKVTWNYISQTTFMYGSKVSFSNGEVTFINPLMPSGLPIHEWLMLKQFSKYKSAPSLPILRRGQHYKLHFDFDATPAGSVYFIIIFYNKNGTKLSTEIVKSNSITIQYPDEAYAYKIKMMNAASTSLIFRCLTITEMTHQDDLEYKSMRVTKIGDDQYGNDMINVIIAEPSDTYPTISNDFLKLFGHVWLVERWMDDNIEGNIKQLKNDLQSQDTLKAINLISYGSKSNVFATYVAQHLDCKVYRTSHEDDDLKEWLTEHVPGNHELKDTNVEVYFKEEQDNHLNYMSRLMNPVRFLDYLDVSKLNGGEVNET